MNEPIFTLKISVGITYKHVAQVENCYSFPPPHAFKDFRQKHGGLHDFNIIRLGLPTHVSIILSSWPPVSTLVYNLT